MVHLYLSHTDDDLMVSRERVPEWEENCDVCGGKDRYMGAFGTREELAEFSKGLLAVGFTEKQVQNMTMCAALLDVWEDE